MYLVNLLLHNPLANEIRILLGSCGKGVTGKVPACLLLVPAQQGILNLRIGDTEP